MAELSVTVKDKTFPIDVPDDVIKRRDENWVTKAAQEHYNQHFASEAGPSLPTIKPSNLPGMEKAAPQTEEIRNALISPTQTPENPGFFESAGNAFKGIGNAIAHPIDTISAMANYRMSPELIAQINDPHADRGV